MSDYVRRFGTARHFGTVGHFGTAKKWHNAPFWHSDSLCTALVSFCIERFFNELKLFKMLFIVGEFIIFLCIWSKINVNTVSLSLMLSGSGSSKYDKFTNGQKNIPNKKISIAK